MYLMIDNQDSYVYNLAECFRRLNREVLVIRKDQLKETHFQQDGGLDGIILSPGPKRPEDAPESRGVVERFAGKVPILGVCLGHQIICHAYGVPVGREAKPTHGICSSVTNSGRGLFRNLPERFNVVRYHSLEVSKECVEQQFYVDALADDGAVMAVSHKHLPLFGVQFHPEAFLSEYGIEIIQNFIWICEGK